MTEYDDLERLVRASLDTHAGEVDTSVPVAARARAAARRHRGRWVAAGAAVAVAAVAVTAVVVGRPDRPGPVEPPIATPSASKATQAMPDDWRTEYWHDVSVQVPADWAWGAGPRGKSMARCGGPNDRVTPYVGRPIMSSDLCIIERQPAPTAPYVWFDAPVEPGTVDLANGYVQDTVEVDADGTSVTVGSDDQVLRERILASVARQDLCPARVDATGLDLGGTVVDGSGELQSAKLCAYSRLGGGVHQLVYARELDPKTFARFERAVDAAPERLRRCKDLGDLVIVTATSDGGSGNAPVTQKWVTDLACDTVASRTSMLAITLNILSALADPGLGVSLPTLIGPQG